MSRPFAVLREALASAWSQPVASLVTIIMVAGMCATVLLTTGRTVGAEQAVLGSIDSAGTRSVVVRAEAGAGLEATVLDRLAGIEGISWAGAFGAASDVENAAVPGGTRVPVRLAWGADWSQLDVPDRQQVPDRTAWASAQALEQLGALEAAGGLRASDGTDYALGGRLTTPDYLRFLEPLVVVAQDDTASGGTVSVLVVIAASPELVASVATTVQSVLAVEDPTKITVQTSEDLATLRSLVQGQLGSYGRTLVIVVFAVTAVLVAAILFGLVMLRRKDFGRRRALGASQGLIVLLLLAQVAALSIIGAVVGTIAAVIALLVSSDPLPGLDFMIAIDVLAVAVGVIAALIPAAAAARRDPLIELRVP